MYKIFVQGIVQGVGFRPYIYRKAKENGLVGFKEMKSKKTYSDFIILKSTYSEGETELPADIFMCDDCLKELKDKKNRRHNYYFITCTNCGPRFSMIEDYPYDRPLTSMNEFKMCSKCEAEYTNPLDR